MRKQNLHKVLLLLLGLFALGLIVFLPAKAQAANPATISFQGKIVNSDGTNIADGTYSVVFRIYNTSNPTMTTSCTSTATCLWEETQSSVSVTNGIFQVELGSACALTSSSCNNSTGGPINYASTSSLYLTMQFNGDTSGTRGGFMYPLIHMNSVPFALYSDNAANASALGGLGAGSFVQLAQGVQNDTSTANPSIYINKNNASGTPNILQLQKASSDVMVVDNGGGLTIHPTTNEASLVIKQTSAGSPTADIFDVTNSAGTQNFLAFNLTSSTPHLKIYDSTGTNYADIYYTGTTAVFGASSGTAVVGSGTGSVTIQSGTGSGFSITGDAASTISTNAGAGKNLTLDSGSGTLIFGSNTTTLQKAGSALTLDVSNGASNSTLTISNSGGAGNITLGLDSGGVFAIGGTNGSTISTCGANNVVTSFASVGGIVSGGACAQLASTGLSDTSNIAYLNGANTFAPTANNSGTTFKQTSGTATSGNVFDIQTANGTSHFIQITNAAANEGAVTIQSVGATRDLTLDSGSGTLKIGGNSTVLQKSGTAFTLDINNASNSTLTVINAGAGVASLSVEGSISGGGNITAGANSTFTTSSGTSTYTGATTSTLTSATGTTVTAASGQNVTISTAGAGTINITSAAALTLQGSTASLDSATTGAVNVGTGANAKTTTIGSANTTSTTNIQSGSGNINLIPGAGNDVIFNQGTGSNLQLAASAATTTDQLIITNAAGATSTTGVDGMAINFNTAGSTASADNSGLRIDVTSNNSGASTTLQGLKIGDLSSPEATSTETGLYVGTGWDVGLDLESGGLQLAAQTDPPAPTTGLIRLYAKNVAGRTVLKTIGSAGIDTPLQNALWANNTVMWQPGQTSSAGNWQGSQGTNAGTAANVLPTTTNFYTMERRNTFASVVTTTNQQVGVRTENMFFAGNAAGNGGFFAAFHFGTNTWTAGDRLFVGFSVGTTAIVTGNPSSLLNLAGFGIDAGDTAITFMHNDGTSTATKDAIAGQPALASNQGYDAYIYVKPNDTTVYYRLDNTNSSTTLIDTSTNTNVPTANLMMTACILMSNGANTAVGNATLGINRLYVETDH